MAKSMIRACPGKQRMKMKEERIRGNEKGMKNLMTVNVYLPR
jgi:hypothetical protein